MRPVPHLQLQAKMRLAFTQACANFPSLNVLPITSAIYQVYAHEAYCIGSTFTLLDPGVMEDALDLTRDISVRLVARDDHNRMMGGLEPEDRKLAKIYCPGLGQNLGMQMLNYARRYRGDMFGLKTRRNLLLASRRNQLANEFLEEVIQRAQKRLLEVSWGETPHA